VAEVGGYEGVKLLMLPRLYKAGDGDCGICFECAIHEAISREDARVLERIEDAASLCNVTGQAPPESLLFGLEKTGTQQLIDSADDVLTDDSRLLYGTRGQPAKLKRHLNRLAGAFRFCCIVPPEGRTDDPSDGEPALINRSGTLRQCLSCFKIPEAHRSPMLAGLRTCRPPWDVRRYMSLPAARS
jgi:hypothetical protein